MKALTEYTALRSSAWLHIAILGCYADQTKGLHVPSADEIVRRARQRGVPPPDDEVIQQVKDYVGARAVLLCDAVRPLFQSKEEVAERFYALRRAIRPRHDVLHNKQGTREPLYFASCANMLVEKVLRFDQYEIEPKSQIICTNLARTTVLGVSSGHPDGAIPSTVDPRLVWESKRYYNASKYGSRIADGVRVAELEGRRLAAAGSHRPYTVMLFDGNIWSNGRPHLCRLCDLLHSGYVDEIIFGKELFVAWEPLLMAQRTLLDYYDNQTSSQGHWQQA